MFKAPFSFEGRIRRTEYGISFIVYFIGYFIIYGLMQNAATKIFVIGFAPLLWFLWAQGAKRCHDLGNSGWWQIIPFYGLWLLFADGNRWTNEYGDDPKNRNEQIYSPEDYQDPIEKTQ
jgi:uncharacterized membrane protein YhaH (DUF805 family)